MAQTKRRPEPTHPTVWVGLALALAGLVVALYAYTGPRVYDILYFFVALAGGFLALAGILVAAWGRAIGQARAQRSRRLAVAAGSTSAVTTTGRKEEKEAAAPPTVAAPSQKKSLLARLKPSGKSEAKPASNKPVFAFKRRGAEGATEAKSAPTDAAPEGDAAKAAPQPELAKERVTLQCPECSTTFSQEGVRPLRVSCPNCAFSAEV